MTLYRCCECGLVIGDGQQPRALTAHGWCHPVCAPDDPDLLIA